MDADPGVYLFAAALFLIAFFFEYQVLPSYATTETSSCTIITAIRPFRADAVLILWAIFVSDASGQIGETKHCQITAYIFTYIKFGGNAKCPVIYLQAKLNNYGPETMLWYVSLFGRRRSPGKMATVYADTLRTAEQGIDGRRGPRGRLDTVLTVRGGGLRRSFGGTSGTRG